MIIAVDGPAGSGKSTVSKIIAKKLGISYLDTGAMYRMITYSLLNENINISNENLVIDHLNKISIDIKGDNFLLNDVVVNEKIRTKEVANNVSQVAALKSVRILLVDMQRQIALNSDTILDGRDIGTKVFPNAKHKFFLTASSDVRAKRRFSELKNTDNEQPYEEILINIKSRDHEDMTRLESPLTKAPDAIEISTDTLNIDEVCEKIISLIGV